MTERVTARQRLLSAAAELFYAEGVGATGIDAITAHAGVAKMSLYNNFSSKAELVQAYLDARYEEWLGLCRDRLATASTPRARVLAVFDSYVDHAAMAYEWGFRGCGLLNAAAELPVGDEGRKTVARQKRDVEDKFALYLAEMGVKSKAKAQETAEHLSFLLEGAMSRAGLDGHDGRLKRARKMAIAMVETL